jgi:hypothetical protein
VKVMGVQLCVLSKLRKLPSGNELDVRLMHSSISLLSAFVKLQTATVRFMSVRPSAWNNSAHSGRIFIKFDIWVIYENLS